MKKCPFCREEIQEDAIKCRFCSSSLLPSQQETPNKENMPVPGPDQTQYIVDKGLLRFGKFVGAALTIFIAVGAFIWGYDVKHADEEARKALDEVSETQKQMTKTADSINKRESRLVSSMDSLDQELAQVRQEVEEIHHNKVVTDTLLTQAQIFYARASVSLNSGNPIPGSNAPGNPGPSNPSGVSGTESLVLKQVTDYYEFPSQLNGKGQTIGFIEVGGGNRNADLTKYFAKLKLPVPKVKSISVDGGHNQPSTANSSDGQVDVDIEVLGTIAGKADLAVYFSPNTDKGFLDAILFALSDKVNKPSILIIGWGAAESSWTKAAKDKMNDAFALASTLGVTIIAASGDNGASDNGTAGKPNVDFPASSPFVLACGGTNWTKQGEEVFNDKATFATGGGFSEAFPTPVWQKTVMAGYPGKTGRAVPDVSANASSNTGYQVLVDGQWTQIGGTTAAVPLWGGLIALINQGIGRNVGYINPVLYNTIGPSGALRDIVTGNNSVPGTQGYSARAGWDPCTGWGSPNGKKLLEAFKKL